MWSSTAWRVRCTTLDQPQSVLFLYFCTTLHWPLGGSHSTQQHNQSQNSTAKSTKRRSNENYQRNCPWASNQPVKSWRTTQEALLALFSTARLCHSEMVALYNGFSGCSNTASALYNAVPDLPSHHLNNEKNIHWWTSCDQVLNLTAKSQTSGYIQSQQQTQSIILKSPWLMSAKQLSRLCTYCLPLDAHAKIQQSHCTLPFLPAAILRMHCTL